ncbi:type II toxin-antitoxin system HicB family antitoxin [Lacticaseibacillus zhaodongensis]|uniref:type II toxin-antitoxin system HicB family antitoxin n=1 Tax=Lacticaseibacillus zhaodongensis TaxID=2668065 RepID=UPI0018AFEAB8|nr:type II toxin-antitoxin system HicB family antitoxin [Lacticaseibacillus zhaodongensis]
MADDKEFDYYMNLHYKITIGYDDEYNVYFAMIPDLPGLKVYGETIAEALDELDDAKQSWISLNLDQGHDVPLPTMNSMDDNDYSGHFSVRTTRSMHQQLATNAAAENVSLNSYVQLVLQRGLDTLAVERVAQHRLVAKPANSSATAKRTGEKSNKVEKGTVRKVSAE